MHHEHRYMKNTEDTFMNYTEVYTLKTQKNTVRQYAGEADLEHISRTQIHEEHRRMHSVFFICGNTELRETVD